MSHWLVLKSHTVYELLLIYSVLVICHQGATCNPFPKTVRTFRNLSI